MGIVLNEEQLATAVIRATWSLITSEVSDPDCMGIVDIDADTGTVIEGEILSTSVRATVVTGV